MAATLFYLSRNPDAYRKVADEVRTTFSSLDEVRVGPTLNSCTYLRACIDESLRISPPAGSALWREVQGAGCKVDGQFIPGGYDVGVGIYAIHHNPTYFPEHASYRPERWLKSTGAAPSTNGSAKPDVKVAGSAAGGQLAYSPFSIGPRSCIGKSLAIMELMLTLSTVLWTFDFRDRDEKYHFDFENSDSGASLNLAPPEQFKLRDHITSAKDGPMLEFRRRCS